MAYDLMSLLLQQGISGDYGAMYPAPAPQFRPSITQPNGQEVQVPQGAVQEAQPTQTPMAAAMAPQSPAQAPQRAQGGGVWERLQHRSDSSAINDGLINAGAAMLAGRDLQQGMAGALVGFNDAYDARKAQTKAEGQPKVIPLADGAFTMLVMPDGTQKVVRNEEVAAYIGQQKQDATAAAVQKMMLQAKFNADAQQAKDDRKVGNEAATDLQGTQSLISKYKQAREVVGERGFGDQLAAVPGLSSLAGAGVFGQSGSAAAARNNILKDVQVSETLLNTALTKGAISNQEMMLFKSPIPSPTDGEAVWNSYIDQRLPVLEKIAAFQASQASKAGSNGASGYQGAASKPAAAPAKSGAFKYLD